MESFHPPQFQIRFSQYIPSILKEYLLILLNKVQVGFQIFFLSVDLHIFLKELIYIIQTFFILFSISDFIIKYTFLIFLFSSHFLILIFIIIVFRTWIFIYIFCDSFVIFCICFLIVIIGNLQILSILKSNSLYPINYF